MKTFVLVHGAWHGRKDGTWTEGDQAGRRG
jgi:hypothetical protein